MIPIYQLYQSLLARVNAHENGHIRPNLNFEQWVNEVSTQLFEQYYEVFERSQNISDALTPFLVPLNVIVTPLPGQVYDLITKPKDYGRYATMRVVRKGGTACGLACNKTIDCECREAACPDVLDDDEREALQLRADSSMQEVGVDKIDNARWSSIAGRKTKGATWDSPKCTQVAGGFKIMPKQLGVVVMDYFRLPQVAKFNYTIVNPGTEDEALQYNPIGSQDLDWDAVVLPEFLDELEEKYHNFYNRSTKKKAG